MWRDFRAFIARGIVIDLAVAVIIGAAFTKVVNTIAEGIISPIIGLITGALTSKTNTLISADRTLQK